MHLQSPTASVMFLAVALNISELLFSIPSRKGRVIISCPGNSWAVRRREETEMKRYFDAASVICLTGFLPWTQTPSCSVVPMLHRQTPSSHIRRGGHGVSGQAGERGYRSRAWTSVSSNGLRRSVSNYQNIVFRVFFCLFACLFASVNTVSPSNKIHIKG